MASARTSNQVQDQGSSEDIREESGGVGVSTTDTSDEAGFISNNLTTSSMFHRVLNRIANANPVSNLQSSSSMSYSSTQLAVSASTDSSGSVDVSRASANTLERVLRHVGAAHDSSRNPLTAIPPMEEELGSSSESPTHKTASTANNSGFRQTAGSQNKGALETRGEMKHASFLKPPLPLPGKSSSSQTSAAQAQRKSSGVIMSETNSSDEVGSRPSVSPVTNSDCESQPLLLFVSASAERSTRCSEGNNGCNNSPDDEIAASPGDSSMNTDQVHCQQNIVKDSLSPVNQMAPIEVVTTGEDTCPAIENRNNSECIEREGQPIHDTRSRKSYAQPMTTTEQKTTGNQTKIICYDVEGSLEVTDAILEQSPVAKKAKKSLDESIRRVSSDLLTPVLRRRSQRLIDRASQLCDPPEEPLEVGSGHNESTKDERVSTIIDDNQCAPAEPETPAGQPSSTQDRPETEILTADPALPGEAYLSTRAKSDPRTEDNLCGFADVDKSFKTSEPSGTGRSTSQERKAVIVASASDGTVAGTSSDVHLGSSGEIQGMKWDHANLISKDLFESSIQAHPDMKICITERQRLLTFLNRELEIMLDELCRDASRGNGMFSYWELQAALKKRKLLDPAMGPHGLLLIFAGILHPEQYEAAKGLLIPFDKDWKERSPGQ